MNEHKTTSITAYIVAGSLVDLSVLDFSCVNVRVVNMASDVLKEISKEFSPLHDAYYTLENIINKDFKKINDKHSAIHVLLPTDFSVRVNETTLQGCISLLKLLYPSDLAVTTVAKFQLNEDKKLEWMHSSSYHFYSSGPRHYENYLSYPIEKEVDQINAFINRFFFRTRENGLFSMALDAYLASFGPIPIHMQFISLCMAMETIVDGTSELLYRIRRSMALLCAENSYHAKQIYENVKVIYNLRSSIIHGGEIKYDLIGDYFPYLRSLVSRMIIKLANLDVKTAEELQEALIFIGFDDRNICLKVEEPLINLFTHTDTMHQLKKAAIKKS